MIAQIATGEEETYYKQPNKVKMGFAGGKARAEKLSSPWIGGLTSQQKVSTGVKQRIQVSPTATQASH